MKLSVVIPCFNRADLTAQCVASIEAADPVHEVLLIDNGSTDATTEMTVAVRNEANRGFAVACNQGAMVATGDVLCFLNNDTIVHPGWTVMVDLLDRDEVGIVGSKLLYPDGRVQHAGVSVNFDRPGGCEAMNITTDWCQEPTPVDAVTGACLTIRRAAFFALNGFDEGFWNGYEDVDLCLRARDETYEILYDPRSVVTHLESQSGPDRWTAISENVNRLRSRHA